MSSTQRVRTYSNQNGAGPVSEREIIEKHDRQNTIERWALNPAVQAAGYGSMLWLGIASVVVGSMLAIIYESPVGLAGIFFGLPMFGYGFHGGRTLKTRLDSYEPRPLVDEVERLLEPEQSMITVRPVKLQEGVRTATIHQPSPGAFIDWLRAVIDETTRTVFSRNEGARREFDDFMYDSLVSGLRGVGWLHGKDTYNGAPVMTDHGKRRARQWLDSA